MTRLHPQGKGGPQAILCGQRLKMWTKNENTTTIRIQKSSVLERSSIYQSWTCWLKKCVFDRSRVADRRYVFAKLTDPLISTDRGCLDCATQKVCPRRFYTVAKRPKICSSSPSSSDAERTSLFKRRPHKMPFGQLDSFGNTAPNPTNNGKTAEEM